MKNKFNTSESLHKKATCQHVDEIEYRTPILQAAKNGQMEVLKYLLTKNCDLFATEGSRLTALHLASMNSNIVNGKVTKHYCTILKNRSLDAYLSKLVVNIKLQDHFCDNFCLLNNK